MPDRCIGERHAARTLCPQGRLRKISRHVLAVSKAMQPSDMAQPQRIRVRLSVRYEVTRRQMLCVGGDKLPFGWSFMSIAHVPMTWNPGHLWTVEVRFEQCGF
jgi:hypothetical protein